MTENYALTHPASHLMPAMTLAEATERFQAVVQFTREIMHAGTDYGVIEGTDKPTLLKPGAEKLTTFFGLTVRYELIEAEQDWSGTAHDDEPFFYYWFRCGLSRGDFLIAEADGSCNSWETKYRYRQASRKCPRCMKATIIKGREEYGGGWLCWTKKGGCGAKFPDGDPLIETQETGRVPNPNPADIVNTIKKMAQKRALVAATLLAVNASEFFTQDLEDLGAAVVDAEYTVVEDPAPNPGPKPAPKQAPPTRPSPSAPNGKTNGKTNGNGNRPYTATRVRHTVRALSRWQKVAEPDFADAQRLVDGEPITEKQEQAVACLLSKAVVRNGMKQAEIDKARYDVMHYLVAVRSTKTLTKLEASALIKWLAAAENDVSDVNPFARGEVASILAAQAVDEGQQELPFTDPE